MLPTDQQLVLVTQQFAAESLNCSDVQPIKVLASSADTGWEALLLDHVEGRGTSETFETLPTDDLTIVGAIRGRHQVEVFGQGRWRSAIYHPGSVGMTPSGETVKLRWQALDPGQCFEMAHLYLPRALIEGSQEEYRRLGQSAHDRPLNALVFNDPTICQLIRALISAMRASAPDLYADQIARALTFHILAQHSPWLLSGDDNRDAGIITDKRLARVVEFVSCNLDQPLTTDKLAREAGVSVHHFSRLFRQQTGRTPAAFLEDLRFDLARRLLRTSDLPIADIARRCGYSQPSAFTAAFQRRFGRTPTADRAAFQLS